MIRYDRLWQTLADKKITQYRLIKQYGFSAGQIGRLKRNMHVSTHTLDTLCGILSCRIEDIVEFIPNPASEEEMEASRHAAQDQGAAPAADAKHSDKETDADSRSGKEAGDSAHSDKEAGDDAHSDKPKKSSKVKKADKKALKNGKKSKKK